MKIYNWLSATVLLCMSVWIFTDSSQSYANESKRLASGDKFKEELTRMTHILQPVWKENLIPAVELALPEDEDRLSRLRAWDVGVTSDYCSIIPKAIGEQRKIFIDRNSFVLTGYVAQALTFWLYGEPSHQNLENILVYSETEWRRVAKLLAEAQRNSDDCRVDVKSYAASIGMPQADYIKLQQLSLQDRNLLDIGNYVGGLNLFFAMLHEAGHVWNGHLDRPFTKADEGQADAFAIKVLGREKMPLTLGIASWIGIFSTDSKSDSDAPSCRAQTILRDYEDEAAIDQMMGEPTLKKYVCKIKELRRRLLVFFAKKCNGQPSPN